MRPTTSSWNISTWLSIRRFTDALQHYGWRLLLWHSKDSTRNDLIEIAHVLMFPLRRFLRCCTWVRIYTCGAQQAISLTTGRPEVWRSPHLHCDGSTIEVCWWVPIMKMKLHCRSGKAPMFCFLGVVKRLRPNSAQQEKIYQWEGR